MGQPATLLLTMTALGALLSVTSACGSTIDAPDLAAASGAGSAGGAGGSGGGGPIFSQACLDYAEAHCVIQECYPSAMTKYFGGDHAKCVERLALRCDGYYTAAGSNTTREQAAACAQGLSSLGCQASYVGGASLSLPECAFPPGSLDDGAACITDVQCASGACHTNVGDNPFACGVCADLRELGDPCDNFSCNAGLVCDPLPYVCVEGAGEGEACGSKLCKGLLACAGGVCVLPAGEAGDACTLVCKPSEGLYCDETSTCQPSPTAAAGEPCGATDDFMPINCIEGYCDAGNVCAPSAGDGQPCTAQGDKFACVFPAACVGGVCVPPGDLACAQ